MKYVNILEKKGLQKKIKELETKIAETDISSPEYKKTVEALKELYPLLTTKRKLGVSAETVASLFGSFVSMLMILHYEEARHLTSRAINFLPKRRN